ncbi:MAG TPA: FliM/FliN family flagellar motor switch protein [Acidobacteriaceae bacterium]|nr:FliM/FliN family flagellar motor switch protein [Acidobacteriaceae bacterium]
MRTFLTAWLATSVEILARELAQKTELRPSARLPQPETAMTFAVMLGGPYTGSFRVTVDRYALPALLAGARITDGTVDADRDRELWRGIMQQVASAAVRRLDPPRADAITIAVEDGDWALGMPSAAYELLCGEIVMVMAFTDEVRTTEAMPEQSVREAALDGKDAGQAAALAAAGDATPELPTRTEPVQTETGLSEPGRIDLLLDVELEASLRFGSREMPLSAVLDLGAGDVVELDRHVSDPVDLLVGDKIVARGEVVLINGAFGLRVIEVAEPKRRLESIRCLF